MARTGIPWRYLPHDYPHWNSVYHYFGRWEKDGIFEHLNALLRRRVREEEGRSPEPTGFVIDAQSVKTSTNVPARERGADVGKRIVGRRRSIIIDTTGLMLTVLVTAVTIQDSVAGEHLLNRLAADHPGIRKGWADRGYREYLVDHAARLGIDLEVVPTHPGHQGLRRPAPQVGGQAHAGAGLAHAPPPPGPRLRSPPRPLHRHDLHRDDRSHDPPSHP